MPQGLDERPLAIDALVQKRRVELAGPHNGRGPQFSITAHASLEPGGVGRAQLGPLRVASIQLGIDERADVDAVHAEAHHVAADVDVG